MPTDLPSGSYVTHNIDTGVREDVAKLEERMRKLEMLVRDIEAVVWGDSTTRDNGLRSKTKRHWRYIDGLISRADKSDADHRHYLDLRRRETCYGLEEMDKHIAEHDKMSGHDIALEVATMNAKTEAERIKQAEKASRWKEIAVVAVAAIMIGGQVFTNLQNNQLARDLRASSIQIERELKVQGTK